MRTLGDENGAVLNAGKQVAEQVAPINLKNGDISQFVSSFLFSLLSINYVYGGAYKQERTVLRFANSSSAFLMSCCVVELECVGWTFLVLFGGVIDFLSILLTLFVIFSFFSSKFLFSF